MTAAFRTLSRYLVYTITALLLFVALLATYVYTHEDEIKQQIIGNLNQRLNSPVQVNGPIYVSWFEDFPSVTLSFPNLQIEAVENAQPAGYALLEAGRLSLSFSLLDLYRGQYQLSQLTITDAAIDLRFDEKGEPNYYIWKSDSSTSGNTQFAIQKLVLRRVKLLYRNASENQLLSAQLTDADFKGNFSERRFQLQAKAALEGGSLQLDGRQFLKNQPLQLNLAMEVDLDAQTIRFPDSELRLNRERIRLSGFHRWAEPLETDLQFSAEKFRAAQLLALYDASTPILGKLSVDGELQLQGRWQYSKGQPSLNLKASLVDARLSYPDYDLKFTGGTQIAAQYTRAQGLDLQLTQIRLNQNNNKLQGSLRYRQQGNLLSGQLAGSVQLEDYRKLLRDFDISEAAGTASFNQTFKLKPGETTPVTFGGTLSLNNAQLQYGTYKLRQLQLTANINEGGKPDLQLDLQSLQLDSVQINGQMQIGNYPALYDTKAGKVRIAGKLTADRWRWSTEASTAGEAAPLPDAVLDVDLSVAKLFWYDYQFNQVNAHLQGEASNLRINLKQASLAGGTVRGPLHWQEISTGYRLQGSLQGRNLGVSRLFSEFNDFGQQFLTHKHLSGKLDASASILLYFDKNFDLLPNQMEVLADLDIRDGALINFEPINALSRFVDANELRNLKFQRLTNHIEIVGGKISIPEMDVNSNAARLSIAGEHMLDNSYKYFIQVSLSDLWQKRSKKISFDPNLAENRPDGGVKLYLTLEGKDSDFTIRYNKLEVRDQLRQQAKEVRKDIGRLVQEEIDGTARNRTYENNRLNDIVPIEAEADTLEIPKEKEFDPVYLRKPKSRRGG